MNLDDIIYFENENTYIDFKSTQYKKEQYEAMIKDIISMANADIDIERYIIIGIKHKSNGEKDILGIEKSEFVDSATYQQIILENIEPEIHVEYYPYEINEKLLGIFKIFNCKDQPYMLKKDFRNLKKGDVFIRKGSQQSRMERRDFDRIYNSKKYKSFFNDNIRIGFEGFDLSKEIVLGPIKKINLPSERAEKKIKEIIIKKKEEKAKFLPNSKVATLSNFNPIAAILGGGPYEERSLEQLEKNLSNIKETYKENDYYEFFEVNSHKINIGIYNEGSCYIEDGSIEVKIQRIEGLSIGSRIYRKPKKSELVSLNAVRDVEEFIDYPNVKYDESDFTITQNIGAIKHHMQTNAFSVPLRVVITEKAQGQTINLICKIYGKNLEQPIVENLSIKVTRTQ